jgi:dTDP-4-amino-4,6-dideoxygalactose transaminase
VWPQLQEGLTRALLEAQYIGGPAVEQFEHAWAACCGTEHAVGTANGTDALALILEALRLEPGAEVVVPSNTFIATAAAVVRAGATPRFADVDPDTLLLTPRTLEEALGPRTRAVVVVHLFGQMPDMDGLAAVAERAGILLLEDAAQAHLARWRDRPAGSFGVAASFSFYPGKNLGAFGDAGAVVTSEAMLADRVRALANHGRHRGAGHYHHELVGTNSRLDALQAIILSAKLARLEEWTRARVEHAGAYRQAFAGTPIRMVASHPSAHNVYHLAVVRVPHRDRVRAALADAGIETGIHYPVPCHLQPPLRRFATGPLPVCERAAGEVLSLPMFPSLQPGQIRRVCDVLLDAVNRVVAGDGPPPPGTEAIAS